MAWTLAINRNWTSGQKKNLQRMLNSFGFTDAEGNELSEDGTIGPKTMAAIGKLNRYQSERGAPSGETRELQKQLNEFGFMDAAGRALREDGVYGPKTDAANSDFENNFLDGATGGKNTAKTVQTGNYPSLPPITQRDVESVITPKSDPMTGQKNPDGTWKQVAAPGAWSGSGGNSAEEQELLRKALEAQRKTAAQNAGRTQGGYTETGGAQRQAIQSAPAPSTGYDFLDRALGKGIYADISGLYNNWNNPFDTILSGQNGFDAQLPNSADMMYNNANNGKSIRSLLEASALRASGDNAAQANQKNPDGTWKQVAAPGAWSGSGGETEQDEALLEKAEAAQDMTRRINEGRTQFGYRETGGAQGQAITSSPKAATEIIDPPEPVGEYISEENYNKQYGVIYSQLALNEKTTDAYARMLQMYQGNTDPEAVRMYELAQAGYNRNLKLQSELQKMMDALQSNRDYSTQAEEVEKTAEYFDNDVDAARAFAEEAMDLMDKHNKECAAIMTVEWVPENRNGEIYMVPKYTYTDVMEGEHDNVIEIALKGLLVPTEGKKYLLHSHPNCTKNGIDPYHDPDHFSGVPNLFETGPNIPQGFYKFGDASIPTLAGSDWYKPFQLLNNLLQNATMGVAGLTGTEISGYDGIYLAAPTGKLYLYEGYGDDKTHAKDYAHFLNDLDPLATDFPKAKVLWDDTTGQPII